MGHHGAAAGRRVGVATTAALAVALVGIPLLGSPARAVQPAPTADPSSTPSGTVPAAQPSPADPPVGGAGLAGSGVLVDRAAGVPPPPDLKAASYVLADLDSGAVLVAKAPHAPHLPASTLKTLTALTVMPRLDPSTVVTAQSGDVVDGSLVGLVPGLTYTVQQLLEGMMLSSGNDAATALARVAGGQQGVAGTVSQMQQVADRLGARDTVVHDPSGLDAAGQVTSAYDLALVAREALKDPQFEALVRTKRATFPGKPVAPTTAKPTTHATATSSAPAKRATFQIQNHNTLLYNYDGAIGVKNGYTVAARWTIIGAAERGGHRYVVTALKRSDRSWRPTAAMLDWAFAYGSRVQPVGRLVDPGELDRSATSPQAAATALAAGSTPGATGQSPPDRWVGAVGLGVVVLLLAALALRARRLSVTARRRLIAPGRQQQPPGRPDRPS
ncbi:MAG TPA: serine hydrolase [Actinomycetales bacterium]|nr:serine hydrolase [Actinomycetales bacterium]